jgi:protein transport protein SEC20
MSDTALSTNSKQTRPELAILDRYALEAEQLVNTLQDPSAFNNATHLDTTTNQFAEEQRVLAESARAKLREFELAIEDIREAAEEHDRELERIIILKQLENYQAHHRQLQSSLRTAMLNAKKRIDAQARLEREALLGGGTVSRRRIQSNERAIIRASGEITEALRRTTQLMQQEVEKSVINATTLDESSRVLRAVQREYRTLDGVLRASRQILARLERGDWTDRLLILFGLLVFCLVVIHVIHRRIWIPNLLGLFRWLFFS